MTNHEVEEEDKYEEKDVAMIVENLGDESDRSRQII